MTSVLDMMKTAFTLVAATSHRIHRPLLKKTAGLTVRSVGSDFGQIVTELDIKASSALLEGFGDFKGFSTILPGSFSEEEDSPNRTSSTMLWQIDPMDGSGDAKKIGLSPTIMVSLLARDNIESAFRAIGGLIYHVKDGYGFISYGNYVLVGVPDQLFQFVSVPFELKQPKHQNSIRIPFRTSYRQITAQEAFPEYLEGHGTSVIQVSSGGAGLQALQLFRSCMDIDLGANEELYGLDPIDIIPNAQPDWKTWDGNPIEVIARAMGMTSPTDIYGNSIDGIHAGLPTLDQMHYRQGYVIARTEEMHDRITSEARAFAEIHGVAALLTKDY